MNAFKLATITLALAGCAYQNPNIYTYGWQPPAPPDPESRSYLGYDPAYEQRLIDHWIAAHPHEVALFRAKAGL